MHDLLKGMWTCSSPNPVSSLFQTIQCYWKSEQRWHTCDTCVISTPESSGAELKQLSLQALQQQGAQRQGSGAPSPLGFMRPGNNS